MPLPRAAMRASAEGSSVIPIDPALIGRAFPTRPYEAAPSGPCLETAVRAPRVDRPTTFAIVLAFRGLDASRDAAGIDYRNVVHAEQRFVYTGRSASATPRDDRYGRRLESVGANDMVTLRCELATDTGEHVCTATSTLLVRAEA